MPALLKGILCVDMLMGRLEIIAWLVVLYPGTWFGKENGGNMRTAFVGAGKVSVETAKALIKKGHEVVIIETDNAKIDELSDEMDCSFLHGDGSQPNLLREVNPEQTDFLFCLTSSDQDNVIASLSAALSVSIAS